MKNYFILIAFFTFFLFSCAKQVDLRFKSDIEVLAFKTLKAEMNPSDFTSLDWESVQVGNLNGVPSLLKIKSKFNPAQTLLFGHLEQKSFYNWIEIFVNDRQKKLFQEL